VIALVAGVSAFVVAGPSGSAQSTTTTGRSGPTDSRAIAQPQTARTVSTVAEYRSAVVQAATAAAEQARTVSATTASTVPAGTLTQLDHAEAQLDGLLAVARVTGAVAPSVGASAGGVPAPEASSVPMPVASPTATTVASPAVTADATPSPDASADPTATADATPTDQPTAGAGEPSPAATVTPSPPDPAVTATSLDALAVAPLGAGDPATTALRTVVAQVTALVAQVEQVSRDAQAATAAAATAADAARAAAEAAATRSAQRTSLDQYANGRIPASALCGLTFASGELRCDAAAAIEQLNSAYHQAFGTDLTIDDSYRSYAAQVACRLTKGSVCAVPGTSNHGLGKAVDLGGGVQTWGTKQHSWLVANAGAFGWMEPSWALPRGSKPEPWHWEFAG
jgi:LAS superfamily LD-carboxypeptidase LdcB